MHTSNIQFTSSYFLNVLCKRSFFFLNFFQIIQAEYLKLVLQQLHIDTNRRLHSMRKSMCTNFIFSQKTLTRHLSYSWISCNYYYKYGLICLVQVVSFSIFSFGLKNLCNICGSCIKTSPYPFKADYVCMWIYFIRRAKSNNNSKCAKWFKTFMKFSA